MLKLLIHYENLDHLRSSFYSFLKSPVGHLFPIVLVASLTKVALPQKTSSKISSSQKSYFYTYDEASSSYVIYKNTDDEQVVIRTLRVSKAIKEDSSYRWTPESGRIGHHICHSVNDPC